MHTSAPALAADPQRQRPSASGAHHRTRCSPQFLRRTHHHALQASAHNIQICMCRAHGRATDGVQHSANVRGDVEVARPSLSPTYRPPAALSRTDAPVFEQSHSHCTPLPPRSAPVSGPFPPFASTSARWPSTRSAPPRPAWRPRGRPGSGAARSGACAPLDCCSIAQGMGRLQGKGRRWSCRSCRTSSEQWRRRICSTAAQGSGRGASRARLCAQRAPSMCSSGLVSCL